jgi:hypothetical protein
MRPKYSELDATAHGSDRRLVYRSFGVFAQVLEPWDDKGVPFTDSLGFFSLLDHVEYRRTVFAESN